MSSGDVTLHQEGIHFVEEGGFIDSGACRSDYVDVDDWIVETIENALIETLYKRINCLFDFCPLMLGFSGFELLIFSDIYEQS